MGRKLSFCLLCAMLLSVAKLCPTLCHPHGLQHARLPYPSLSSGVCSNSSIELVMPSNHLILCHTLLLLPSIFPSIRVFTSELTLRIRWPKYWSFNISPSSEYSGLFPLGLTSLISLKSRELSRVFSSTTIQMHQFFGSQSSLWSNSHICTRQPKKP